MNLQVGVVSYQVAAGQVERTDGVAALDPHHELVKCGQSYYVNLYLEGH